MLQGKDHYVDMAFPIIAPSTDRSFGSERRCELTGMSVQYSEPVSKVPAHHRDEIWVGGS